MPEDISPNALVIRFKPTAPEAILAAAGKEFRRTGRYGCSVFADVARSDESRERLQWRLLEASNLAGRPIPLNDKFFICARAAELLDLGMEFWKDGDEDEVPEHYSVVIGHDPGLEDAQRFLEPFGPARERPRCSP
jgi:hypothetical protein